MQNEPKIVPENFKNTVSKLREAGTNPRKVGAEKTAKALHWVYRWGWSYPFLLDSVASPGRRGMTKKLVEKGLLTSYPNPGAGGQKGTPHSSVCMTRAGQQLVEGFISEGQLLDQNFESDIPWHQLQHDGLVQRATAMNADLLSFSTPKEISKKSAAGVKQPDAIWETSNGKLGIELELTRKNSGREINQALLGLLMSVKDGNQNGLEKIAILSHSKAILDRYKRKLAPGQIVTRWEKDDSRRWKESEKQAIVPDWAENRFIFKKIDL